mmetsp:Transcript_66137/g.204929  ORF Transcript_66137/g.204929 Transcript_66137/m.204929 type:complete len:214 (+) Transcript_66137:1120-1761(+)
MSGARSSQPCASSATATTASSASASRRTRWTSSRPTARRRCRRTSRCGPACSSWRCSAATRTPSSRTRASTACRRASSPACRWSLCRRPWISPRTRAGSRPAAGARPSCSPWTACAHGRWRRHCGRWRPRTGPTARQLQLPSSTCAAGRPALQSTCWRWPARATAAEGPQRRPCPVQGSTPPIQGAPRFHRTPSHADQCQSGPSPQALALRVR